MHSIPPVVTLLIALFSVTAHAQLSVESKASLPTRGPAAGGGAGAALTAAPVPVNLTAPSGLTPQSPDPTQPSARMQAAMMAHGGIPEMSIKGLVIGSGSNDATVIFEVAGGSLALARPGIAFTVTAEGETRRLLMKGITSNGIEIEAPAQKQTAIVPSFAHTTALQRGSQPNAVSYVEFRDLPLLYALRMLSDQTGNNYSASVEANKIAVNTMLRNVPADSVVEEICKSHNLWFKTDSVTKIMRIMTVAEYEKDLVGFREEQTEVFTLKFPNVTEVTSAIADLYGNRVQISSSADDNDDSALRDLTGRFDRYDVLTQRTQNAGSTDGTVLGQTTYGGGVGGAGGYGGAGYGGGGYSGGGGFSGGAGGRGSTSAYTRQRYNQPPVTQQQDDQSFRNLTPDQIQRVEQALMKHRTGDDRPGVANAGDVEDLRKVAATIYVSSSRRNNIVVVRTADARALQEIRALVTRLDVQTPLVLLEVKVVTIQLGNDFRSAFDYQFGNGHSSASFTQEGIAAPVSGGAFASSATNSNDMTFTVASQNFMARMQLFEQLNRIKTLATPTLLTANNEVSRLFLGEERPVVQNISSQTILTDNNVATTPNTTTQFRNVGNTLVITPNINSDRTVTLRLVQENSYITPNGATIPVVTTASNNSSVQNVPVDVVGTKTVSGTFVAKDGMAVAIGGMIEIDDSNQRGQVPILGSIPLVGQLFSRQTKSKSRNELVVIVCPHIMSTPADGERVTKDLLQRLAPQSVQRLVQEGFYPTGSVIPRAVPIENERIDDVLLPLPVHPRAVPAQK